MPGVAQQSQELLDVVDEHDCVIGQRTRGEIHQLGLMHRSVHILVFARDDRFLLQKRSMFKDECGGLWDTSCAGHVEAGQHAQETALRELAEELGLQVRAEQLRYLFKVAPDADNGMEFASVFALTHDGPFTIAEDEIERVEWYSPAQIDRQIESQAHTLTSGFVQIWQRHRATIGD